MTRELVERIVDRALERSLSAILVAGRIEDLGRRFARSAVLYEREACWWDVLRRYTSPSSPYYLAVLAARQRAHDHAKDLRRYAARATERAA